MWWRLMNAYALFIGTAIIVLAIILPIESVTYRLSMIALGLLWIGPLLWRFAKSRWFNG